MSFASSQFTHQQEHFASALAMRRLDALLSASPYPTRNQTVLIGCPAEEWHTFTPLLLALLLRRRGLNVIYLGANVPNVQFAETASEVRADLVILVAQTLVAAAALQHVANTLTGQGVPTAFGGRIFNLSPSIVESIPSRLGVWIGIASMPPCALTYRFNADLCGATMNLSNEIPNALPCFSITPTTV
jgi:methylmalonyl-CoA mutase cobalamin-binding subunit